MPSRAEAAGPALVSILLNGERLQTDTPPEMVNDRTMLPVRAVAEAFGSEIEWHPASQAVVIRRQESEIILQVGSPAVRINQTTSMMDVAPYIRNDRTMVPVRFVAEAFAAEVEWDAAARTVLITDRPDPAAPEPEEPPATQPPEPSPAPPEAPVLHRVTADSERVEIHGSQLKVVNAFTLAAPARVVVDFDAATLGDAPLGSITLAPEAAYARQVRVGEPQPGITRVVVEVARSTFWQVAADESSVSIILSDRPASLAGLHIVIDAGHGGTDPGAIGPTGYREKEVNLAVSLLLGQYLSDWGATVTQTRVDDRTLSLNARADLANRLGADLFVSIHHNSARDEATTGTETYYYLTSSATRPLAELVQRELLQTLGSKNRGVQTASFSVLRRTAMPAILVEAEFIQNRATEARMRTPEYHDQVAAAVARGIAAFWLKDGGYLFVGG